MCKKGLLEKVLKSIKRYQKVLKGIKRYYFDPFDKLSAAHFFSQKVSFWKCNLQKVSQLGEYVLEARADFKSNFEPLLRGMRVATLLHSVGMCLPSSGPGEATTSPRQCRAFPSRTSQSPPLAGPISEFLLGGFFLGSGIHWGVCLT